MKPKQAIEVKEKLEKFFEDCDDGKVGSYDSDTGKVVVASARHLTIESQELSTLQEITKGHRLSFGRIGANFRLQVF
jgi:hypothetical protein